jgi:hypothetical protein
MVFSPCVTNSVTHWCRAESDDSAAVVFSILPIDIIDTSISINGVLAI